MKILVTGGAGFIGSHIVDAYITEGHQVSVFDDLSSGKKEYVNTEAEFYQGNITDYGRVTEVIARVRPDIINHHAAQMSVRRSVEDPVFDATVNVIGLLNLLESASTTSVKKIIFASSGGAVYGDAKNIPTPDDYMQVEPLSPYGITKFVSEHYLRFYHQTYNIPYVALRYANVYGPRQNPHGEAGVIAIFVQKLLSGQSPVINGDGKQTRDYVYVGDVVEANVRAVKTAYIGTCNIGTGKETDVLNIVGELKNILKTSTEAVHGPAKPGEQRRSCLDVSKAKDVLGWSPKTVLKVGLLKTVEYFRSAND